MDYIRNLLYHIYPVKDRGVWQWNIAQLLRRISQFNGQRVVSVVIDSSTDSLDDVKKALQDTVTDFLCFPNDKNLGETRSFIELMKRVENIDPRQITYYAHAKGVKYKAEDQHTLTRADGLFSTTGANVLVQVRRWIEVMHSNCLDYPELVDDALINHSLAGSFVKLGQFPGLDRAWHYAGTFFWMKNSAIFGGDWQRIANQWWGVEAWPGTICPYNKAFCLLFQGEAPNMRMYERTYWTENINPIWKQWQQDHSPLKRAMSYKDVLPSLKLGGNHKIIVTGPQRSGTQIGAKILAHDLNLPFIEEREFNTHNLEKFIEIIKNHQKYVIHAPAMAPYIHEMPGIIVFMNRNIKDIIRSQRRVDWKEHGLHAGSIERTKYFEGDTEPSAQIKIRTWQTHQRILLETRAIDLDYESLKYHPLWVNQEDRNNFKERQCYPSN